MVNNYRGARELGLIGHPGFSVLMFCGTVWVLVFGRLRAEINKLMLSVAVLLLLFSTTVSVKRLYIPSAGYSPMPTIANDLQHNPHRGRFRVAM